MAKLLANWITQLLNCDIHVIQRKFLQEIPIIFIGSSLVRVTVLLLSVAMQLCKLYLVCCRHHCKLYQSGASEISYNDAPEI